MTSTQSLNVDGVRADVTFTESRSFQLFMEGLRYLQAYEATPEPTQLQKADAKFTRCVESYPSDMIAQFYLGMVKALKGYPGLATAETLFNRLSASGPDFLRLPAEYNLAAVYVEHYDEQHERMAEELLNQLAKRLDTVTADSRASASLRAQVMSLLAYVVVRRQVNAPLDRGTPLGEHAVEHAERAIRNAKAAVESPEVPDLVARDTGAEVANAEGILFESRARIASDAGDRAARERAALRAEELYKAALHRKYDWLPALQNLARLYQTYLGRRDEARGLWERTLLIRPGDPYSHYMLGNWYEGTPEPRLQKAFEHYWQAASDIKSAKKRLVALEKDVPSYLRPIDYVTPTIDPAIPASGSTD